MTRKTAGVVIGAVLLSQLGFAGPAAAAVPGLVTATGTSASNPADVKSATAFCPAGTVLLSGGYQINGATGEVVVDDLPLTNAGSITVIAYEEDPYENAWSLTAYAICAEELSGLVRITDPSPLNSQGFKGETAICPLGKVLIGGGFLITGATGEATVDDIFPNAGVTTVAVTAYETDIDYPPAWSLTAHATCAHDLTGLVRRSVSSAANSNDSRTVVAACQPGEVMVGAGYGLHTGLGNVVVDDMRPNGNSVTAPTSITVVAYEADPLFTDVWDLEAHALCAAIAD